jgi:CheY-like chemotaxis protein
VTDLIMPRLSGVELAHRLREYYPDLRVLFLSGYTEEAVTEKGVAGIDGAFLQKPVLPTELAAKVRELLDSSRTRAEP